MGNGTSQLENVRVQRDPAFCGTPEIRKTRHSHLSHHRKRIHMKAPFSHCERRAATGRPTSERLDALASGAVPDTPGHPNEGSFLFRCARVAGRGVGMCLLLYAWRGGVRVRS